MSLAWTIEVDESALKQLKKIDRSDAARILDYLRDRITPSSDPRQTGKALQGSKLGNLWRYRVGDYRVLCDIQDQRLVVLVVEIGHRKEFYR